MLGTTFLTAQEDDAFFIKEIYQRTLSEGKCYDWLHHLSENIGGRLAGSDNAEKAVDYTYDVLKSLGVDSVWKQPCMVPVWERGGEEIVKITSSIKGEMTLNALALGNSIGTGNLGIKAEVIELQSLDELDKLGRDRIKGKIVFFNRPMNPSLITTFHAYGEAVDQRVFGAARAVKHGAVACLVRSMTTRHDDYPHTGVQVYDEGGERIPSLAISTNDADKLSALLKEGKVEIFIKNNAQILPDRQSHNVVAEIKGSTFPDEIILVGGHLDAWDVGGGAHDDGAGCVHSIEVIHMLQKMGYKPKRTIRCVMFMNEENGLGGGKAYAEAAKEKGEFHLAAIESDAGGFTPRGFTCTAEDAVFNDYFKAISKWSDLFSPYDMYIKQGGGGADIGPLKEQGGLLIGFRPDSQRYFDYHHTTIDRIDAVHPRELKLGAASITSLVYLIDKYGLKNE